MQSHDNREPNERFNLIQNLAEKIKTAEDPQKVLSRWGVQVGYRTRRHVGLITLVLAFAAVVTVWSFPDGGIAQELRGEITGIAITLILVDRLLSIRTRVEHEKELIEQLNSPVRDFAVEALRLIRKDKQLFSKLDTNKLMEVKWAGADLRLADLSGVFLLEPDLSGANLFSANLSNATLLRADLSNANLFRVNLSNATLLSANLSGTKLWLSDLSGADLRHADLSGADLSGADLSGADLSGADLSGADLHRSRYDISTIWPEGFDPIAAGAELVEE